MKTLRSPATAAEPRRGAALMLSFMVLLVLILILAQIKYSTDTAARVARNEETLTTMDLAIESSLLQVYEDLKSDAADAAAGGAGGAGGAMGAPDQGAGNAAGGDAAGAGGAGGQDAPTDSKEDEWARAQRTEVNEIQLRILIQDEDSKFNVLSVLTADEEEADKALDRLARVIEWSRKGTAAEIDGGTARRMATTMAEYMKRRADQVVPKPTLLTDDEQAPDIGLPLSLREFMAVDPELFPADLFRDFIDENGAIVHSLGTFLTVWSSVATLEDANQQAQQQSGQKPSDAPGDEKKDASNNGQLAAETPDPGAEAPADGQSGANGQAKGANGSGGSGQQQDSGPPGWAINVNTAPGAVLHSLMPERDMPYRFWDDAVLYRNEKDDTVEENDDPPLDEYGRPIIVHQFFHTVDDLAKVDGWENLEPIVQGELKSLLKTQSQVFSIYITARKPTGDEQIDPFARQDDIERTEANWQGLVRTVRCVVWRHTVGQGEVEIVPIVRWEVLDYAPFEVLDFPEARNYRR